MNFADHNPTLGGPIPLTFNQLNLSVLVTTERTSHLAPRHSHNLRKHHNLKKQGRLCQTAWLHNLQQSPLTDVFSAGDPLFKLQWGVATDRLPLNRGLHDVQQPVGKGRGGRRRAVRMPAAARRGVLRGCLRLSLCSCVVRERLYHKTASENGWAAGERVGRRGVY